MKTEGVVNLFENQAEFSLFDESFLMEVQRMKEKNLAVKLLENLIKKRVRSVARTNLVKGEKFSELFTDTLNKYIKGMLTNEEVIEELMKLAKEMMDAEKAGNGMGLTNEEMAFYDALTKPQAVKDFYTNEQLVNLTKELTEMLRKNRTIDWTRRESERANMRRLVKRLLKRHKYPPEEEKNAMDIVMRQCEQWADDTSVMPIRKLENVEDDQEVRNRIFGRLHINPDTTDAELQMEVLELYGMRYPDMSINDWRHIIEDYTPMVRELIKNKDEEAKIIPLSFDKAAEP